MKNFFAYLAFISSVLLAPSSKALVEARVTYGLLASSPKLSDISLPGQTVDAPAATGNYGIGADALVILPVIGLGAGIRYENLAFKVTATDLEYKSSLSRTALLINYRIINTLVYLGPIFTYGLSHTNNITATYLSTAADLSPDSSTSYSAGLEAGVKLGGFLLGGEAGYMDYKWKSLSDKNNVITSQPNLDMSGGYFKVILGFGI